MIRVDQLTVQAGGFELRDLSFEIPTGQYAILMGRTGSGKTTLLETLCGLRPAHRGSIWLNGQNVTRLRAAERGIGYVPQDRALFHTMTVREHLSFSLEIRRWDRTAIEARVRELAELLGLAPLLHRRPAGLSGGESQRVALGRALAFRPAILFLDEPLSALDDETREEIYALLESVQARTGVTTLHITHHRGEADRLADRKFQLRDGRILEDPSSRPAG